MSAEPKKGINWALWLPLVLFGGFFVFAIGGLAWPADKDVESAMIGKPLPEFTLPPAGGSATPLTRADFAKGNPRLINIFASWCVPCAVEAPQLEQMARAGVPIDGIAIRDRDEDIARFLQSYGNPFARIARDDVSQVQIAIGSSGVPETFVIDGAGNIRYQHLGPIMDRDVATLMSELRKAETPL